VTVGGRRALRHDPRVIRRPPEVHGAAFDLLVVGGSLFACALARDAACAGLRTLLVAPDDFGARGRQRGWLAAGLDAGAAAAGVARAFADREWLLRMAPHRVRPARALVVAAGSDSGPADVMPRLRRLAAATPGSTLPPPQAIVPELARCLWPELTMDAAASAVLAFDAVLDEAGLARNLARDAAAAGAAIWPRSNVVRVGLDGVEVHAPWCDRRAVTRAAVTFAAEDPVAVAATFRVDVAARLVMETGARVALATAQPEIARIASGGVGVLEAAPSDVMADAWWRAGVADGRADACWRDVPGLTLEPQAVQSIVMAPSLPQLVVEETVAGKFASKSSSPLRAVTAARLTRERLFPNAAPNGCRAICGGGGVRAPLEPLWRRHGSDAAIVARLAGASADAARVVCPHRGVLAAEVDFALAVDAAVRFEDVVRRLFCDASCPDSECLRRAHGRYLRGAGEHVADADPGAAIAAALAALAPLPKPPR